MDVYIRHGSEKLKSLDENIDFSVHPQATPPPHEHLRLFETRRNEMVNV